MRQRCAVCPTSCLTTGLVGDWRLSCQVCVYLLHAWCPGLSHTVHSSIQGVGVQYGNSRLVFHSAMGSEALSRA